MTVPAKSIPETVAHLPIEIVEAALVRNDVQYSQGGARTQCPERRFA